MDDSRPWLALARCYIADNRVVAATEAARTAARLAEEQLARLDEEATAVPEVRGAPEVVPTPEGDETDTDADGVADRGLADIANARSATLREELRGILEADLQYAVGLAATAEGWQDPTLTDQLQEGGGIWSAMADEYRDDRDFSGQVDDRRALPWPDQDRGQ